MGDVNEGVTPGWADPGEGYCSEASAFIGENAAEAV